MNVMKLVRPKSPDDSIRHTLLSDLYWLEYQDTVEEARAALRDGDKLKAIALAIQAYKIRGQYEYYTSLLL